MRQLRQVKFAAEGYKGEIQQFNGRDHLVVPVVALVEGVLHAMNAPAPEFVAAEEFGKVPGGWNGRPIFEGHPLVDGVPVSGNHPDVLEGSVGLVFNTSFDADEKKLRMEAWIDIERAEEKAPKLLKRLQDGDPIEISVGVFVATDETTGEFNGKRWSGAWHDLVPDHLALLVEGDTGACSREMGCGVRAASQGESTVSKPNFLGRLMSMFRDAQPAADMTTNDLHNKLYTALRGVEPSLSYILGQRPAMNPTEVIYSCYEYQGATYQDLYYRRPFTLASDGTVTVGTDRHAVEPVMTYPDITVVSETSAPVAASAAPADNKITAAGAGTCSCQNHPAPASTTFEGEDTMTKEQMVEFLKSATAEQLAELGIQAIPAAPAAVETPAPVAPVVETPAVAAQAPTFETLLAAAPADVRAAIEAGKVAAATKRAASVKALKDTGRCQYSDAELQGMAQADLDRLVALAAQPVSQPVDYSLQAAGQAPTVASGVPAMPSMVDAIKAARGQK